MPKATTETRRGLIEDLLAGRLLDEEEAERRALALGLPTWPSLVMVLTIDGSTHAVATLRDDLARIVGRTAGEIARGGSPCGVLVAARSSQQLLVLVASRRLPTEVLSLAKSFGEAVRLRGLSLLGVSVSVALGGAAAVPAEVAKSFSQARRALSRSSFLGDDGVLVEPELALSARASHYSLTLERQLCAHVRAGEAEHAARLVPAILDGIVQATAGDPANVRLRAAEVSAVLSRAALEGGADSTAVTNRSCAVARRLDAVASLADLRGWMGSTVTEFTDEVCGRRPPERRLIDHAVSFIRGNYRDELTLQRVASAVNVSPYYLSHLFRRQCGCTFLECLTRTRIDAAKHLLEHTSANVTEIGSQIGYDDPNYFAQVFKRIEGITPSDYRRNLGAVAQRSRAAGPQVVLVAARPARAAVKGGGRRELGQAI